MYSCVLVEAIKKVKHKIKQLLGYWIIKPTSIAELMFTDYMVVLTETKENLQHNSNILNEELTKINMKINTKKTRV